MYLVISLLINLLIIGSCYADSKQSAYTTDNSPALTDTAVMVKDPSGTPLNRKSPLSSIFSAANLTVDGANVGVASTVPGARLDVNGTVRATAFSGDGSALTGISSSQFTTINTNDVYLPNNGNIGVGTTLTTGGALVVMNGNVGIGTWLPSRQLKVKTTAGTYAAEFERNTSSTTGPVLVQLNKLTSTGTAATGLALGIDYGLPNDAGSNKVVYRTNYTWDDPADTTEDLLVYDIIIRNGSLVTNWIKSSTGLMRFNDETGGIPVAVLDVKAEGSTPYIRAFSGSSTVNFIVDANANVGIGTSVPLSKLSIKGADTTSTAYGITIKDSSENILLRTLNNGNIGIGTSNPQAILAVGSTGQFNVTSAGAITSTGNVGISTTAPTTCGCKQFTNGLCTTVGTCT